MLQLMFCSLQRALRYHCLDGSHADFYGKLADLIALLLILFRFRQAAAAAAVPEEDPVHQPATGPSSPLLRHDTAMIPEGANEDEEEDDLNYPGDEEEPKVGAMCHLVDMACVAWQLLRCYYLRRLATRSLAG